MKKYKVKFEDEFFAAEFYEKRDRLCRITNINRNSIFLSQFSFFEHIYKMLCKGIQAELSIKIKINDLPDDFAKIDKFRKFSQKVVGIEMTQSDKNWQKISDFRKIRNSIAHNGSIAGETDVIKIVKNNPDFDFAETSKEFAIKSKKYLLDFNTITSNYIKDLCHKIDEKLP